MRRELISAYVIMGLLLVALETLRYIDMNFVVYEHFPIFPVGFLLEIGTGFWATKVSALRYGVLGGAVLGLTWSLIEGFILPMLGMSQDDQVVTLLINTVVIGAIFGLLGGLPVWLRRFGWRWSWIAMILLPLWVFPALIVKGLYTSPKMQYSMKRMTLTGKVMDVFEVFDLERSSVSDHGSPDGRVLVVGDQVYPFVENPINARLLRTVRFGDPVQIEAEIIQEGHLVQILSLTRIDSAYTARDSIRNRRPIPVSITGKNLCQCGIRLGSIQSNCSLGHFHHLATPDKLYSYLLDEKGQIPFAGKGYHYREVRVTGELYGDFFLKVSDIKVSGIASL